jgi:hypothetical protein
LVRRFGLTRTGKRYHCGCACVNFRKPLSMRAHVGLFTANPDELKVLAYHANSIAHRRQTPTVIS